MAEEINKASFVTYFFQLSCCSAPGKNFPDQKWKKERKSLFIAPVEIKNHTHTKLHLQI